MFTFYAPSAQPHATLYVNGHELNAPTGVSVAAALLTGGHTSIRHTPVTGSPRGPWCLMGACFDCLVTIDGAADMQACLTPVRDGMRIELQSPNPAQSNAPELDPCGPQR